MSERMTDEDWRAFEVGLLARHGMTPGVRPVLDEAKRARAEEERLRSDLTASRLRIEELEKALRNRPNRGHAVMCDEIQWGRACNCGEAEIIAALSSQPKKDPGP